MIIRSSVPQHPLHEFERHHYNIWVLEYYLHLISILSSSSTGPLFAMTHTFSGARSVKRAD